MKASGTVFHFKPREGLANRLRAIKGAQALARKMGWHLKVYWYDLPNCHVKWADIFNAPGEFTVVDVPEDDPSAADAVFSRKNPRYFCWKDLENFLARIERDGNGEFAFESFREFCPGGTYDWLEPIPAIREKIEALKKEMGFPMVGVHIRRTDLCESRLCSPTELFKERMRDELVGNPHARFFLATDDDREKDDLMASFPGRVFTRSAVLGRYDRGGVADAVIDLWLLASCTKILGSAKSSFGSEAAKIGKIKKEVVCDKSKVGISIVVETEGIGVARLERCLRSLIGQWMPQIEILCVNGNPNGEIARTIRDFAAKDSRVREVGSLDEAVLQVRAKYLYFMPGDRTADYQFTHSVFARLGRMDVEQLLFAPTKHRGPKEYEGLVRKLNELSIGRWWLRLLADHEIPKSLVGLLFLDVDDGLERCNRIFSTRAFRETFSRGVDLRTRRLKDAGRAIVNSPAALIYLDVGDDNQAALRVRCRRTRRGLLRFWMGWTVFCALRGLGLVRRYKCN